MKILIVGAGIGGLSLAAFLRGSDVAFDIVEKSPDLARQGFSIGLWANGRNMLKKLGLSDELDVNGSPVRTYRITDHKGSPLREYDLRKFERLYGVGYTHIDRGLLLDRLVSLVGRDLIRTGRRVAGIQQTERAVSVTFDDGSSGEYDLVIGADGIHSSVRKLAFGDSIEAYDDWRVWYAWMPPTGRDSVVTESVADGSFLSLFELKHKALAVMMAPAAHGIWDDEETRISRLRAIFRHDSLGPSLLDTLAADSIAPSDLCHVRMREIVSGRVALLGDAAHGFEPYAGLGASMAMEDAYVLSSKLLRISDASPLSKALKDYEKARRGRVKLAQRLTRRMRLWATIKSPFLRRLVNFAVPYVPERFFVDSYNRLLREEI